MKIIYLDNSILVKDKKSTFLSASATATATTITVESIVGFAVNQNLLIGEIGSEKFEIIHTHAVTAPTGTTITLASGLTYSHSARTKIYVIDWDKAEFSHADTVAGDKDVLTTIAIQADQKETQYKDIAESAGYYFVRFVNTIPATDTYSGYSDPIPYVGFTGNQVGHIISYALGRNKLKTFTDNVDHSFCIDEINASLRYITGKFKRWSNLQQFDYILGQTARGIYEYELPSDIYERNSNRSILSVKIGDEKTPLDYIDKIELNKEMEGVCYTQVATEGAIGATSLVVDNAYDFADTGSINVYISNTLYTITYTGITRGTGTFTGIPASGTGAITATIPVDTNVWYGEDEGEPYYYTVYDGSLYVWSLPDTTHKNLNLYLNYYTAVTAIDSDADELDLIRYDCIKHYLVWAIRSQIKNDGRRDLTDVDYLQFLDILRDYKRTEISGQRSKRNPNVRGITY